jgi:hypothetical protein
MRYPMLNRLLESICTVSDIKLEYLKNSPDVNVIRERADRLRDNLCLVYDDLLSLLSRRTYARKDVLVNCDVSPTLESLTRRFNSLPEEDREAILEFARQTLPPRSRHDADVVFLAAMELLCDSVKGKYEKQIFSA